MGAGVVGGAPYATARLIFDLAESEPYRAYVRGKIALSGADLSRVSLGGWLDMTYAILMEAPHDLLAKIHDQMVMKAAIMRPDRSTWGLTPEQVRLSNRLTGRKVPKK